MQSIHDLFNEVKQHPDYVAGVVFVRDDFDRELDYTTTRAMEDRMTSEGFGVAEDLAGANQVEA